MPPPVSTPPDHSAAPRVNHGASLFLHGHGNSAHAQHASCVPDGSVDSVDQQLADDPVEQPAHSRGNKSDRDRTSCRPALECRSKRIGRAGRKNLPNNQRRAM